MTAEVGQVVPAQSLWGIHGSRGLSHPPEGLTEAGLGCGAMEAADPSRVLLVLCCFPLLLLQLQTEVCNVSFPNCWEEAAFSL